MTRAILPMLIQEVIRKKREGLLLDDAEIEFFVRGIVDESISEAQISAFAMATFFTDMQTEECVTLTHAMQNSGDTLAWQSLDLSGPVVDKHSTGGVGDKVSLILAPLLAACGAFVPMISGRGLGHTGGTLDKLDSIPGYDTAPDVDRFQSIVGRVGCAIVGQTANMAPADKRFYAVRDVTATIESLPLIVASILSKKLTAGLDALVLDIKTGTGAFADSIEKAHDLAARIVDIGGRLGLPTNSVITDMSQVLGRSAGNALEVSEVVDYLADNQREPRLDEITLALGAEMLLLCGLAADLPQGREQLVTRLNDGSAAEVFSRMVSALGGPCDFLQDPVKYLPKAAIICPVYPGSEGVIAAMDVRAIGNTIVELGGGRRKTTDTIDHAVGLTGIKGLGEYVDDQTPMMLVHAADRAKAETAAARLQDAITVAESAPAIGPAILGRLSSR